MRIRLRAVALSGTLRLALALVLATMSLAAMHVRPTAASSGQILIVYADAAPPTLLRGELLATARVPVDLFDTQVATPTLAQLQPYTLVVVFSNDAYADGTALGNVLADYQDAGGIVVASGASFFSSPRFAIAGRWLRDGYSPYVYSTDAAYDPIAGGVITVDQPLLRGVDSLDADVRVVAREAPGATRVAAYSDGSSAIAIKTTGGHVAIGVTAYLGNLPSRASADYARVIANALALFTSSPASSP